MKTNEALTQAMALRGIGKRALAHRAQVSRLTVQRLCRHDRVGSLDTWIRLSGALGCPLDDLIGIDNDRYPIV